MQIKRKKHTRKSCLTQVNWRDTVSSKVSTNNTTLGDLGATTGFFWESYKRNENKRVAGALLTELTQSRGCLSSLSSADLCCLQNQGHTAYPTHGLISRLHSKNPISAEASARWDSSSFREQKFQALNINLSLLIYHILHGLNKVSPKEENSFEFAHFLQLKAAGGLDNYSQLGYKCWSSPRRMPCAPSTQHSPKPCKWSQDGVTH